MAVKVAIPLVTPSAAASPTAAPGEIQLRLPEPSVFRTWLIVPALFGKVNVKSAGTLALDFSVVANDVPAVASFKTIVPAVAPVGVPIVTVWFPKFGVILVPSIAAAALTSALTMDPSRILAELTAPLAIVVAPEPTMLTSPLIATSVATLAFPTRI